MQKDERDVFFFDVVTETKSRSYKGLAPFPHEKLAQTVLKFFNAKKAYVVNSKKQVFYIADMTVNASRCEMLIGFADPEAADPTFTDWLKGARRVENKVGDEGLEHTAHIVWEYGNVKNSAPCPFLLESAPGVPASKVVVFLNKMFRAYSKLFKDFWVDDPVGKKDAAGNFLKVKAYPSIELLGHPSSEFIKDLKSGELQQVELYTQRKKGASWDAADKIIEDRSSVILKPNPNKVLGKAKALLDSVLPGKANDYEFARIKFKTDSEVNRTVSVMSKNYGLLSTGLYVRKERLTGLGNLPTAFAQINPVIIGLMRKLV
ncbi:hypothetical protein [Stenotrophomonas maltophilia]